MHIHIGHGFFGAGNLGDDLVLGGFLRGVAAADPRPRITCATAFDIEAQRRRFPAVEWFARDNATSVRLIAACDAWLGLGAGLLTPSEDWWLLSDQLAQLDMCRFLKKPAYFMGCSVERREAGPGSQPRRLLDAARWIWPRDGLSVQALRDMDFERFTPASDLSHLVLNTLAAGEPVPGEVGFVLNFEDTAQFDIASLEALCAGAATSATACWLVQEVRRLDGSEEALLEAFRPGVVAGLEVRRPDYASASLSELVEAWGRPGRIFTSRFHGAIVGAWFGSRVAAFERAPKITGLARDLGLASFTRLPSWDALLDTLDRAKPVDPAVLRYHVALAQSACDAFLLAIHR